MKIINLNPVFLKILKISLIPIFIGGSLVFMVSGSFLVPEHPSPIPQGMTLFEIFYTTLISVIFGMLVVFFIYFILIKRHKADHLVVAAIMSPIIFITTIFSGNTLLLILFKSATPNPFLYMIVSFLSIYLTILSFALIMTDILPNSLKNLFVIAYSSIFGTFLGISLPTFTMFFILLVLVIEDYLLISRMPPITYEDKIHDAYSYTQITYNNILIGAGDFVVYSVISSHTMLYFGLAIWLFVSLCLIIGIYISLRNLGKSKKYIPALPIPVGITLVLWVLLIFIT